MTVMRSAALGLALACGAAGAHAQGVVSRQIDSEPVETVVTQTPTGTVVTRRPLAAAPTPTYAPAYVEHASTTYMDETVGAAPDVRTTTRTTQHVVHHTRRATTERAVTHTVHTARRVARLRPLVLAPAQRQVIYRTLVQEQVIPRIVPRAPAAPVGYPPFPRPAVTTGYAVSAPAEVVEDEDYAAAPVAAAAVYPVGAVLPASVAVEPLPARVAVAVPAAQPYGYASIEGRVLLVDPVTNTVVADITP